MDATLNPPKGRPHSKLRKSRMSAASGYKSEMPYRRYVAAVLVVVIVLSSGGMPVLGATARLLIPASGAPASGAVEISVGFESDAKNPVTRIDLYVDSEQYGTKVFDTPQIHGVASILWDTTRYGDGLRPLSAYLYSGSRLVGKAYAKVEVRNVSGKTSVSAQTTPNKSSAKIAIKNLRDGERISGKRVIQVVPANSLGASPFVAVYVDKTLKFLGNRQPTEVSLDTTELTDGTHLVEVQARTMDNQILASSILRVNVENAGTLTAEVSALTDDKPTQRVLEQPTQTTVAVRPSFKDNAEKAVAARSMDMTLPKISVTPKSASPSSSPIPAKQKQAENYQPKTIQTTASTALVQAKPDTAPVRPAVPVKIIEPSPASSSHAVSKPVKSPNSTFPAVSADTKPGTGWRQLEARASTDAPSAVKPVLDLAPAAITPTSPEPAASVVTVKLSQPNAALVIPDSASRPVETNNIARPATLPKEPVVMPSAPQVRVDPASVMPKSLPNMPQPVPPKVRIPNMAIPDNKRMDVTQHLASPRPLPAKTVLIKASRPATDEIRIVKPTAGAPPNAPELSAIEPVSSEPKLKQTAPELGLMALAPSTSGRDALARPMAPSAEVSKIEFMHFTAKQPRITKGSALVCLRNVVESLGGTVVWDNVKKTASACLGERNLVVDLRSGYVAVNGKRLEGSLPPVLENGRTVVPAMTIVGGFGVKLTWNKDTRSLMFTWARRLKSKAG